MRKKNKRINKLQAVLGVVMSVAIIGGLVAVVQNHKKGVSAASDASFSISPTSGTFAKGSTVTVTVSETSSSSDNVNAVQANLTYPASELQFVSAATTGPFTLCAQNTGGGGTVSIGCASPSAVSGTQSIAKITFTVLATGNAKVAMASDSDIVGGGNSVWDNGLTSVSYTLSDTSSGGGGGSSSGGGGSKSGSGSGKSSSGSTGHTGSTGSTTKTGSNHSTTTRPTGRSNPSKGSTTPTTGTSTGTGVPQSLGSISVNVKNKQGKFIDGATVTLDGSETATTNQNGLASFSAVTSGSHQISIKAQNEATKNLSVELTAGENKIVPITLAPPNSATIYFILGLVVVAMIGVYFIFRKVLKNNSFSFAGGGTGPSNEDIDSAIVTSDSKSTVVSPGSSGNETVIKPTSSSSTPTKPTTPSSNDSGTTTIKPTTTKGSK